MSEEFQGQEDGAAGSKMPGRKVLVLSLSAGMVAGAILGSFIVGPLLADSPEATASSAVECVPADGGSKAKAPAAVHSIENIVINPAQSNGTRFLMASVGFGMTDAHGADLMKLRDAEVRDIVVRVLGSRSVAELSDVTSRDDIKAEMREKVSAIAGDNALVDVYFSQFVIQ